MNQYFEGNRVLHYRDYVANCTEYGIKPWSEDTWLYRQQYEAYLKDPGLMPTGYSFDKFVEAHKRLCSYFDKSGTSRLRRRR